MTQKSYAKVSLHDDRIIVCTMHGFMDEEIVRRSLEETRAYIRQLRQRHHAVYLLIDASGVTGQSSGARSLAKTIGTMGLTKIAVYNRNPALGMIIQYLIRSGGMRRYAQVFHNRAAAMAWLLREHQVVQKHDYGLRLSLALLVLVIVGCAWGGWATHNDVFTSISPSLKPMNPVVGLVLVLQAIVLLSIKKVETISRLRTRLLACIAVLTMLFGFAVLLQTSLGVHLHVDDWLFKDVLDTGELSGRASPRAAVLLMLLGGMELAILTGQHKRWQQYVFHFSSVFVFVVALLTVIGYGFGYSGLYAATSMLPMPLNTAICMLLLNHGLQSAAKRLPFFDRGLRTFTKYSQPIIIGLAIVLLTGVAWHQSSKNQERTHGTAATKELVSKKDNIQDRVNAYVDILRGYRSFFGASEFVTAGEYRAFFASSDLATHYPGISAISFARSVPAAERRAFEASMKQQATSVYPTYKNFAIFPASSQPVSYPVTYVEPHTATTNYGFDLATNDTRRTALEKARDTNDVAATGTIDLNASRADSTLPKRPGFFITIPVYDTQKTANGIPHTIEGRRNAIYGYVNTVFEDKKLFEDIFKNIDRSDARYVISNAQTEEVLYEHDPHNGSIPAASTETSTILVAGQVWKLSVYTTPWFGLTSMERLLPTIILSSGMIVAFMATALAMGQVRRKEQAIALAASMTEDLNNERNAAVVVQQKDEAILSSIGDAVFAVDTVGTIILFNRAAEDITGCGEQDAVGKSYTTLLRFIREKDGKPIDDFITTALSGKPAKMAEGTLLERQDGTTVPVADSAAPIINAQGVVEGAVVVFRDITQEKELERLKNEFVSMASHELRTPMGAIRAFVSMILSGDYGPVNKNLVEPLTDIHAATLRLVDLVNDLLNVARIEAGRMKFSLADAAIGPVLQNVTTNLTPLAQEKHITLSMTSADLPLVQVDEEKVVQVVTNLVGNALKFTDKGTIHISTVIRANTIEVHVTDTGTGISEADQQKLFGKFEQVSSVQEGRPAGTGLGLYISREIIRKMGGELWIKHSTLGHGSTFAFTLVRSHTALAKRVKMERAKDEKLHPDAV